MQRQPLPAWLRQLQVDSLVPEMRPLLLAQAAMLRAAMLRLEERQRKTQVALPWVRMLFQLRQRLSDRAPTGSSCFSAGTSEMACRPVGRLHNTSHNRNGTLSELRRAEPCWAAALQRDLSEQ